MRRCGMCMVLVMLWIVAPGNYSFAFEEKTVKGTIIHDSSNAKLITNFVEDVVSLLPPDMVQTLEPYFDTLNREANFVVRDDYWRSKVIDRDYFKSRLEAISTKDGKTLASQLGGNVKHIFEIALRPNGADVMGDGLKKNLREVPNSWKNGKFTVVYEGYSGRSLDSILETLYEYNNREKRSLYPDLVKTTAEMWSSVWQKGGERMQVVTKTFVRKPADLDFWKPSGRYVPSPRR